MLSTYRPTFYGGSGEEAEKFICAVRDKAINERKRTDNEWIVMYAESCLAGEVLRWYTYLDLDTKNNWEKLQQALLTRYPRGGTGDRLPNLVPTPAAAASVAPAPSATRRGRIRISNSNALELEWIPSSNGLQTLSIPGIPGYDFLGTKCQYKILFICAVDSHTNSTALAPGRGILLINNWKISIGDRAGGEIITVSVMPGSGAVRILVPRHAAAYWANFHHSKELLYPRWSPSGSGVRFAAENADQEPVQ
ncbi:hypothetical protein M407DRAFT_25959 [Tulasnella calospora MUT 4182]|uniref:Uncharacterized protein n=1 Tax=Tulasnella calospora MUT 4182 TaxID=1051891 RepID=A0A0C3QGI4_9AGAM|nr:hypothetical protein M407DRAFT_25959 [Tulasnella calospora MUT 4182]